MASSTSAAGVGTAISSQSAISILDASAFPHIVHSIISHLDYPTTMAFRLTSSFYRDQIDANLFNHIMVELRTHGVQLLVSSARPAHRRLPCLPSDFPVEPGVVETTASRTKRISRQRQLLNVGTIDVAHSRSNQGSAQVHYSSLYGETQTLKTVRRFIQYNPTPLPITAHAHTVIDWYPCCVGPPTSNPTTIIPNCKRHVLQFRFTNYTVFDLSLVDNLLAYPREVESSVLVFNLMGGRAAADMTEDPIPFFVPDLSTALKLIPGLASVARRGGTVTVVGLEQMHTRLLGLPLGLGGKNGENTVNEFRRLLLDATRQPAERASADNFAAGDNKPIPEGGITAAWGEAEQNEASARVSFQTIAQWRASADPLESQAPEDQRSDAAVQLDAFFGGDDWYEDWYDVDTEYSGGAFFDLDEYDEWDVAEPDYDPYDDYDDPGFEYDEYGDLYAVAEPDYDLYAEYDEYVEYGMDEAL